MDTIIILHCHGELFTQAAVSFIMRKAGKYSSQTKSNPQNEPGDDQDVSRELYSIVHLSYTSFFIEAEISRFLHKKIIGQKVAWA